MTLVGNLVFVRKNYLSRVERGVGTWYAKQCFVFINYEKNLFLINIIDFFKKVKNINYFPEFLSDSYHS